MNVEPSTHEELFGGTEVSPVENPYPAYRRLRHEHPVMPVRTTFGEIAYLVTRYDDVHHVLRNDSVFSNRSNEHGISLVMGRTIIEMDGDEHLRHRKLVRPEFAPRALKGDFEKTVEDTAHELIDGFAGRGHADLVKEFTFTFPLMVLTKILGLPVSDYDTFHRWATDLTLIARDPEKGMAASRALADYLHPVLEQRKAEPAGDLISALAHARIDDHRLTEEEIVSFLRLLILAGAETSYHLIGSALFALMNGGGALQTVVEDRTRIESVMTEVIRWESPIQMTTRETLAPVTIAGFEIPARVDVIAMLGSANRDESQFDDPDRFDLQRTRGEHISFGFGRHFCLGARLAKLEFTVAINTLLDRLPDLRPDPERWPGAGVVGLAFRGPNSLPVLFG